MVMSETPMLNLVSLFLKQANVQGGWQGAYGVGGKGREAVDLLRCDTWPGEQAPASSGPPVFRPEP